MSRPYAGCTTSLSAFPYPLPSAIGISLAGGVLLLLTPSTSPHGRISFSGTGYVSFTENTCSKSLAFAVHPIAFKNSNYASFSPPAQTSLIPAVAPSCSRSSSSSFDSFAFSTMFITFAISSLFSAKPSFKSPRFLCGSE